MSAVNTKDFEMMCVLLESLLDLSEHLWSTRKDLDGNALDAGTTMRNFDMTLIKTRSPLTHKDLDFLRKKSRNSRLRFSGFYLPPLDEDKEFIPILSLDCNLGSSPPRLSLRVGMTKYIKGKKLRPVSLGFRFEMGIPKSNHNYHHMQLTGTPHDEPLEGCPELPETYPCVITPAKCSVSLLLCLLLSLYGSRISKHGIFTANIDKKYKTYSEFLI